MSELDVVTAIKEQREENRAQLSEVRNAVTNMADSISKLSTTLARVEERHFRQDDAMRRIGKQVDDHEKRIRVVEANSKPGQVDAHEERLDKLERSKSQVVGSWHALSILAGGAIAVGTLIISVISYLSPAG